MAILTVGSGKDYSTIALAVAAVSAGDTIQIYAGTYNETSIGLYDDNVTFECGTDAEGEFENVLLSGSNNAADYLIYSYAEEVSWNNLTFTGYLYVPSRTGFGGQKLSMNNCFIYGCGNLDNNATITLGGTSDYTAKMESCKVFSMQGKAIAAYSDYVEINNCLVISDDTSDYVAHLGNSYPHTTASFCTFAGSNTGGLMIAAKVINCIVSGTALTEAQPPPGSSNNYSGAKGIYSDDSSYNIAIVDAGPYYELDATYRHTATATEKTLVPPYFTNPGTLGSSNYLTDDYTLVQTKAVSEAIPTSYFTMEDGAGATLSDVSTAGNSRNGTLVNVSWDSGNKKVGSNSLYFRGAHDGTGDYVTLNDVTQDIAGSDFSIFWWVKTSTANNGMMFAIEASDNSARLQTYLWLGKWGWTDSTSAHIPVQTSFAMSDNNWHHLGVTFNNTSKNGVFYVDGTVTSFFYAAVGTEVASSDKLTIGCAFAGDGTPGDFFDGNIDEFSVWNKVLAPEHIQALYDAGNADTSKNGGFPTAAYTNPAIDTGVGFNDIGDDIIGTTRPQGATPDIGAYEFITAGYGNRVIGIDASAYAKIIGITKANIGEVLGVE